MKNKLTIKEILRPKENTRKVLAEWIVEAEQQAIDAISEKLDSGVQYTTQIRELRKEVDDLKNIIVGLARNSVI